MYATIGRDLIAKINNRYYIPGDLLPSTAQIEAEYGVSMGTARRALLFVEEQKYAKASQGYGFVVTDPDVRSARNEILDEVLAHLRSMPHDPGGRVAVYFYEATGRHQHEDPAFLLSEVVARIEELR